MKLFVTGANGQVARALAALDGQDGITVICRGRPALDITDPASIRRAISDTKPDLVINPAAYTAVDKAEEERDQAFAINRDGAGHVAAAARDARVPVVHISTDYVFDGSKTTPYAEIDPVGPTSVYGASKLGGEKAVAAANPDHVILRTAWVFGPAGKNFPATMLHLAADRDALNVVADQHGTPTYAPHIAQGILAVCRRVLAADIAPGNAGDWRGIFHMVAEGETTWAGFAEQLFKASAEAGGPSATVNPITTQDYPTPAARPANSRLDTARFADTFSHRLPPYQHGIHEWLQAECENR